LRRSGRLLGQDVAQPHEGDEVVQLRRGIAQPQLVAGAAHDQLESRQRLDRRRIGDDAFDVAEDDRHRKQGPPPAPRFIGGREMSFGAHDGLLTDTRRTGG
jgi:hypothetical protein